MCIGILMLVTAGNNSRAGGGRQVGPGLGFLVMMTAAVSIPSDTDGECSLMPVAAHGYGHLTA